MKKLFLPLLIVAQVISIFLIYLFVSIYFDPGSFYYFGFSFLIMIFVSIVLLIMYVKFDIRYRLLKFLLLTMSFINFVFFAIYFFFLLKYVIWFVGSSGE